MHKIEWEEGRLLDTLEEMEKDCFWMIDILVDVATCKSFKHCREQIPGCIEMIKKLAERCREERESFGLWREDEREPDEILGELEKHFGVITKWMTAKIYPKERRHEIELR